MNKFKFIANEELKKRKVIEDCAHCPNTACSGLQMLDNTAQLPKLASQYVKKLAYACETLKTFSKTSDRICEICYTDKDSTVYREAVQKYVCDECMNAIADIAEETRARRVRGKFFTEIDSTLLELNRQIEANIQYEQERRTTDARFEQERSRTDALRRHAASLQSLLKDSYERQTM